MRRRSRAFTKKDAGKVAAPITSRGWRSVTQTPLVMTADFLVDIVRDGRLIQLARAVKPASELDDPRVLEKLDIERLYPARGSNDADLGF